MGTIDTVWFRDSYYTLKAFNECGHFDELEKYFEYIQNVLMRETGRMQPLYSITGQKDLEETHLDLEGYLNTNPCVSATRPTCRYRMMFTDKCLLDCSRCSSINDYHSPDEAPIKFSLTGYCSGLKRHGRTGRRIMGVPECDAGAHIHVALSLGGIESCGEARTKCWRQGAGRQS